MTAAGTINPGMVASTETPQEPHVKKGRGRGMATRRDTSDPESIADLREVALITRMMREHFEQIEALGVQRREIVLRMRDSGVTYREIGEAMGVTNQSVYKIIRGDL